MALTDEQRWLKAAVGGDRQAADALLAPNRKWLTDYFRRRVSDLTSVDDLVQDVLSAASVGLSRFKGGCPVNTWVFAIANNRLRNYYDRDPVRKGKLTSLDTMATEESIANGVACATVPNITDDVIGRDRVAKILTAMKACCSDEERRILLLIYQGKALEEIGELLGRNAVTVRSSFKRGREKLLAHLVLNDADLLGGAEAINAAWKATCDAGDITAEEKEAWERKGGRGLTDEFRRACLKMAKYLPTSLVTLFLAILFGEKGH